MKKVVDREELYNMLRSGKTQAECAEYYGVTEACISRARKEINFAVIKNVSLENASRVVDKNLNTIDQLQKINIRANEILDAVSDPEIAMKAMGEIRNQLKLQLELFQSLYDMQAVQEFQKEVLACIGEVSKEVRDEIIDRLSKKSALRKSISYN